MRIELMAGEQLVYKGIVGLYKGRYEGTGIPPGHYGDAYLTSYRMIVFERTEEMLSYGLSGDIAAIFDFAVDMLGKAETREVIAAFLLKDVVEFGAASSTLPIYSFDLRDGQTYTVTFGHHVSVRATNEWVPKILEAMQRAHDQDEMIEL